jgi:hypothetical protein
VSAGFLAACALVFVASATVTIVWCQSMASMGGMGMPGDWTMSMAWMKMPDQTSPGRSSSTALQRRQEPCSRSSRSHVEDRSSPASRRASTAM